MSSPKAQKNLSQISPLPLKRHERCGCGALTRHRGFAPSQGASGRFAFLPFLVLECNLSQVTVTDKCRMILFIGSFLKLMGKVSEAEKLFLNVEDMLQQVE